MAARDAYDMAGIGPDDIDVCELHDCFSIASIIVAAMLAVLACGGPEEIRCDQKVKDAYLGEEES